MSRHEVLEAIRQKKRVEFKYAKEADLVSHYKDGWFLLGVRKSFSFTQCVIAKIYATGIENGIEPREEGKGDCLYDKEEKDDIGCTDKSS